MFDVRGVAHGECRVGSLHVSGRAWRELVSLLLRGGAGFLGEKGSAGCASWELCISGGVCSGELGISSTAGHGDGGGGGGAVRDWARVV